MSDRKDIKFKEGKMRGEDEDGNEEHDEERREELQMSGRTMLRTPQDGERNWRARENHDYGDGNIDGDGIEREGKSSGVVGAGKKETKVQNQVDKTADVHITDGEERLAAGGEETNGDGEKGNEKEQGRDEGKRKEKEKESEEAKGKEKEKIITEESTGMKSMFGGLSMGLEKAFESARGKQSADRSKQLYPGVSKNRSDAERRKSEMIFRDRGAIFATEGNPLRERGEELKPMESREGRREGRDNGGRGRGGGGDRVKGVQSSTVVVRAQLNGSSKPLPALSLSLNMEDW